MSARVIITEGPLPPQPPQPPQGGAEAADSSTGAVGVVGVVGAVLVFDGIVRRNEDGKPLEALDYTAYEPMAQNQIGAICDELIASLGLTSIVVEHSRGRVPVGACSFRLTITSPHRKEALRACDEFIDRLKQDVPIWKEPVWA